MNGLGNPKLVLLGILVICFCAVIPTLVALSRVQSLSWPASFDITTVREVDSAVLSKSTINKLAADSSSIPEIEQFVISLERDRYEKFILKNNNTLMHKISWHEASNGWNETTLDLFANISGQPALNLSKFDRKDPSSKFRYDSPHAVGCFLSHWLLWRDLLQRPAEEHPSHGYTVYEDDSVCQSVVDEVIKLIPTLPSDWDLIYLGGKPFTYFREKNVAYAEYNDSDKDSLHRDICRGAYGKGESPLAPDGSRNLSLSDPYWQTTYTTNTEAYAINPRRLEKIVNLMRPKNYVPIDIKLGDSMNRNQLNVYMPVNVLCNQGNLERLGKPFQGYFAFSSTKTKFSRIPFFNQTPPVSRGDPKSEHQIYYYWQKNMYIQENCGY